MIHDDYAHYLWLDGKLLAKLILWHLWLKLRWNTFLEWDLYTFERFSSIWISPLFLLIFFINKIRNDINLIFLVMKIPSLCFHFSLLHFWKMLFRLVWGLILYKVCSYFLKHIYFMLILLLFIILKYFAWGEARF